MIAPWRADVATGLRLVRAGGRAATARLLLTAVGIGLCLIVLMLIASVSPALQHRGDRTFTPAWGSGSPTFTYHDADVVLGGRTISGMAVSALTAAAPAPPGADRFPGAGQVWASPALAAAVAADPGGEPARDLGGPVVGTIAATALPGPDDLVFYLGVSGLSSGHPATDWVPGASSPLGSRQNTVVVAGGTVLVTSLLLFVALAGRLGAAARDRRLAAVRLIGLGPGRLRRIAATEAGVAAVLGVLLGWAGFLSLRLVAPRLRVDGAGFAPGDVWPGPVAAVVITAVVLAIAVVPALAGSRRRFVEPLGVVRRPAARPRGAWRLVFVLVTLGISVAVVRAPHLAVWAVTGPTVVPAVLWLGCVPVALPWVLDRVARGWTAGGPAARLGIGRVRQDPVTAARTAGGVCLALAGAIAMFTLLAAAGSLVPSPTQATTTTSNLRAQASVDDAAITDLSGIRQRLRQVAGVTRLAVFIGDENASTEVHVADCATVRTLTGVAACVDGQVFAVTDTLTGEEAPSPGTRIGGDAAVAESLRWTVSGDLVPVTSTEAVGIWMTPVAFQRAFPSVSALTVQIRAAVPDADLPAARAALMVYGWRAAGSFPDPHATVQGVLGLVVPGLLVGSALCLAICALGQFVVTAEAVSERRRSLALAAAAGVPRRVLAGSALVAAGLPIAVGVVVAAVFGTALANTLLALLPEPPGLNLGPTAAMAAAAVGFVLLVAAATLPMVGRASGPAGLRTE